MEIKIPATKDLRIKHLPLITDARMMDEFPSGEWMVDAIHIATGVEKWKIRTFKVSEIIEMYNLIINSVSDMKFDKNPDKEIVIGGVTYELINPEKAPIGWHADCTESDFESDKVRLACICYIPKGTTYGEMDANDNLIYPIRDRHDAFAKEFPLEQYVRLHAFFLRKFNALMKQSTEKLIRINRIEWSKRKISTLGSRLSTLLERTTKSQSTK